MPDIDSTSAAAILYGKTAQASEQPPATPAAKQEPPAPALADRRAALNDKRQALHDETQRLERDERAAREQPKADEETPAEKLFGSPESIAATYRGPLGDTLNVLETLTPPEGVAMPTREVLLSEAAQVFSDAQIRPEAAGPLHGLFASTAKNPPSAETVQGWHDESVEWLKGQYPQGYEKELERVQQFVAARPGLATILDRTGLANHPQIVRALVENSVSLRIKPRARKT